MLKDMNKDNYAGSGSAQAPSDMNLKDRDQEIQFGGGDDNDHDPSDKELIKKKGTMKDELQTIEKNEIVDAQGDKKDKIMGREKAGKAANRNESNKDNDNNGIKKDNTNVGPMGLDPNASS